MKFRAVVRAIKLLSSVMVGPGLEEWQKFIWLSEGAWRLLGRIPNAEVL